MSSENLGILMMVGIAGYGVFKFWKTILKLIIGLVCFCVLYTFMSLKKYFDNSKGDKEKIEQVVRETVMKSTPNF